MQALCFPAVDGSRSFCAHSNDSRRRTGDWGGDFGVGFPGISRSQESWLADGSIATVSETTSYEMRQCSAVNAIGYTNKTEWQMAVADLAGPGHIIEFLTTADNIALSNEYPTPPIANANMGNVLTWDSSSTQFVFTFYLKAYIVGYDLVFDDQESGGPAFSPLDQQRSISIGDVDNRENDDFEIGIPEWHNDAAVFAIGITIGDNNCTSGEGATVYGINSFAKALPITCPDCPGVHGFLDVISTVLVTRLFFNESTDGDDIFVRDFCFGVLDWSM